MFRAEHWRSAVQSAIQELRTAVADVLPAGPCYKDGPGYDDVFLLRFVLTWEKKGGLMESAPALREAIKCLPAQRACVSQCSVLGWRQVHPPSGLGSRVRGLGRRDLLDRLKTRT